MSAPKFDPDRNQIDRLQEIERLKAIQREEDRPPPKQNNPDRSSLADFVLALAKQFLGVVQGWTGKKNSSSQQLKHTLLAFQTILENMMQEDKSQDFAFLKSAAQCWKTLLKETSQLPNNTPSHQAKSLLIQSIQSEPKYNERSFGFYLEQSEKMRWIPFPYADLVNDLHRQYKIGPSSSLLYYWKGLICNMLSLLAQ